MYYRSNLFLLFILYKGKVNLWDINTTPATIGFGFDMAEQRRLEFEHKY